MSISDQVTPLWRSKRRQRGSSLILFTFMTTLVLIPIIGLAIDGGVVFWVKAKLSSAVDAAAIAAGRSINVSLGAGQNSPTAITAAQEWFSANFPAGWLGTSVVGGQPTVTFTATTSSTQQVTVSASAVVPLFFMRLLHINSYTVTAIAQSSRRNLNLVLVLDRSGSMGAQGSNACPTMIAAAQNFVNLFTDGFDTLGLVTFSSSANWAAGGSIDYTPTTHFKTGSPSLSSVLGQIVCTGATSSAQGLHVAYQSIQNTNLPSAVNAIVFFTDGQPNQVVANYTTSIAANGGGDTRYDPINTGSLVATAASTCSASSITGGLTTALGTGQHPGVTGYTGGLFDTSTWVPLTTSAAILNAAGCGFNNNNGYCGQYGAAWVCTRQDIAYIPNTDLYGNPTNTGYKGLPDTFTSGPYSGRIRDDEQTIAVMAAAFNAADNQATTIRNDTTYSPIIFTIGLDGAPDMPIDSVFLERVANDPRSPIYDSTHVAGYYAYAENPGELNQAFHQIASIVLRLSK